MTKIIEKDDQGAVVRTIEYDYDPFDRRIQKTNSPAVGPADIEQYAYDGPHIALRFDNGTLANRYLHGPAIDQILADEQLDLNTGQTDQLLWPLADNLGTVRDLAEYDDASGITSIANHLAYDSFGQVTSETNSTIDHLFGYTGRERDEESALYYYRARYYDPAVGRFTSEDPIGFAAGDVNLSRYVGNGATNATDPSGLLQKPGQLPPELQNGHVDTYQAEVAAQIAKQQPPVAEFVRTVNLWGPTYLEIWVTKRGNDEYYAIYTYSGGWMYPERFHGVEVICFKDAQAHPGHRVPEDRL